MRLRVRPVSGRWITKLLTVLSALLTSVPVFAAPAAPKSSDKARESEWVFELLPKPFQKNPRLDLTVITEMTDEGKKRPPVSPGAPVYFELFSGGYHVMGDDFGDKATVSPEQIRTLLTHALAANGFLPAGRPSHPPSLLIFYVWGVYNELTEVDPENPTLAPAQIARNLLDRAVLVGGRKFAEELGQVFEDENKYAMANRAAAIPMQVEAMDPIQRFKNRSFTNEMLMSQVAGNIYYVVASAYDYRSAASAHRTLLWRTRMTVSARGVAQDQTLPTLVLASAPYFGKEMPQPEILSKRAVPEGTVEVGTPTVVESASTPAEASPPPRAAK